MPGSSATGATSHILASTVLPRTIQPHAAPQNPGEIHPPSEVEVEGVVAANGLAKDPSTDRDIRTNQTTVYPAPPTTANSTPRVPNSILPTPVRPNVLEVLLQGYDAGLRQYLVQGFTMGFRLGYVGHIKEHLGSNSVSAHRHPEVVRQKIQKELAAHRIAGPFVQKPFIQLVVSPLGLVEKHEPNTYRMIHKLSYQQGSSVNDGIPKAASTIQYASISDAIQIIQAAGPEIYLSKMDIKDAFRLVPIHPADYPLLGFMWEDQFYFDKCLPMGCSSSCAIFEKISSVLAWIAK